MLRIVGGCSGSFSLLGHRFRRIGGSTAVPVTVAAPGGALVPRFPVGEILQPVHPVPVAQERFASGERKIQVADAENAPRLPGRVELETGHRSERHGLSRTPAGKGRTITRSATAVRRRNRGGSWSSGRAGSGGLTRGRSGRQDGGDVDRPAPVAAQWPTRCRPVGNPSGGGPSRAVSVECSCGEKEHPRLKNRGGSDQAVSARYGIVCGPSGRTQTRASGPDRESASTVAAPTSSIGVRCAARTWSAESPSVLSSTSARC